MCSSALTSIQNIAAGTQQAFCKSHLAPLGSETTSALCGSQWSSILTPLLPTHLLWGAQNTSWASATPAAFWRQPSSWLQWVAVTLKQWFACAYATVLRWVGIDSSATATSQRLAAADLKVLFSWKSAQRYLYSIRQRLLHVMQHPRDSWNCIPAWRSFTETFASSVFRGLLSIPRKLVTIPGRLVSSPWQPKQWLLTALQHSTAWHFKSWQDLVGAFWKQPHRAGQVQLIAYKPGAGQLSAWWTQNHK